MLNKNKQISYIFLFVNFLVLIFNNREITRIYSNQTFLRQCIVFLMKKKKHSSTRGSSNLFVITQIILFFNHTIHLSCCPLPMR